MALTTCPDCQGPLSDTAPSCPKCGWSRAAAAIAASQAQTQEKMAAGQPLVALSSRLLLAGVVLIVTGLFASRLLGIPLLVYAAPLGLVVVVAAAIVGQIGRAKQGRVI